MKRNKLAGILILAVFISVPALAFAAGLVPCGGHGEPACSLCYLYKLAQNVMNFLTYKIAPVIAVLVIAFGGFLILTSGGNPGTKQRGFKAIKAAVIGIIIAFGAWIIINEFLLFLSNQKSGTAQIFSTPWTEINCLLNEKKVP